MRRSGLTRLLPGTLRRLEPQAPRMARAFSDRLIAPHEDPRGETRYRVALLTGCMQDLVFPDVNRDTADVLLANGCAVDTPSPQPCCGSLHAHNGDSAIARGTGPPADRSHPAGPIRCHHHQCRRLRLAPAALRAPARRRSAISGAARPWDAKLRDVHEWLVEIGCRAPGPRRSTSPSRDLSRVLSPRARSEDHGAAARVLRSCPA